MIDVCEQSPGKSAPKLNGRGYNFLSISSRNPYEAKFTSRNKPPRLSDEEATRTEEGAREATSLGLRYEDDCEK